MCLNIFQEKGRISEITQEIIQDFFKNIFLPKKKGDHNMNMNEFLQTIVDNVNEFDSIIIFDLKLALPLYDGSKDPNMHDLLFDKNNDIGRAVAGFENLMTLSDALDSFGRVTNYGSLDYSIFKLEQGNLMVYFHDLPDTKVAIIFFGRKDKGALGALIHNAKQHIQEIRRNFPNQ
ncbi:MAG: hypothetical protein SAL70_09700 [Scytonema sp. PMC 1070.18]|nr:hypothetical protein [Scytonema sp. PMC 1070.18]